MDLQQISEGQLWTYKTRKEDNDSHLIIFKIEKYEDDFFVHVAVKNIAVDDQKKVDIDHMPFSLESISQSILDNIGEGEILPSYIEAYDYWREQEGGVWNIEVKEAVKVTIQSITT